MTGVPAAPSGHSGQAPEPVSRLAHTANVPNADALVDLMSAWGSLSSAKFHKAYLFFDEDRQRIIEDYGLKGDHATLEATALLFAEYADDIYDRRSRG